MSETLNIFDNSEGGTSILIHQTTENTEIQRTTGALMASGYQKLGTQEALNGMFVVQKSDESTTIYGKAITPTLIRSMGTPVRNTQDGLVVADTKGADVKETKCMAMQGFGDYKESDAASSCKQRDHKDATDLVIDNSDNMPSGCPERQVNRVVRRLTPLECERLQGYPDGWTNIGEWTDTKGKVHKESDSPRYKALGNSIAIPFWEWMSARMVKHIDHEPTMASLFDGIGGFPLVYSRCGCRPVWASEIEEFPIAVTKIRFPEE